MKDSTLIMIGSGVEGLLTSCLIPENQPDILTTQNTLFVSITCYSQGKIVTVQYEKGSVELHSQDTVRKRISYPYIN